ncbi:hypothetical protein LPTSP4_09570 [Leptospira ryugenii]|uniref:Uncharacterized protein n=2 Tax=Leptospira ryugenii TaxID=1917863 RepID=A0A2P2DXU1_9LEPT|nr:hypothetical protein LPTSP4_09570 [Leptospira ryugenii]
MNSKLRDEIILSIKNKEERRTILLSINIETTIYLLRDSISNIFYYFPKEDSVKNRNIEEIINLNFNQVELMTNLFSKITFNNDIKIFEKNINVQLDLNSYNELNENILFLLLETYSFTVLTKILKGINNWNDYSIFTRNMNNEIFIFNLYNKKERELKEISRSLIFDHFNSDNINIQNEEGNSLLHLAILNMDKEIVNFCLLNGANPYLKNHINLTPFENQDLTYWEDVINAFSVEVNV